MRITQFPVNRLSELRETYLPQVQAVVVARRPSTLRRLRLPGLSRHQASRAELVRAKASRWGVAAVGQARQTLARTSPATRELRRRPIAVLLVGAAAGALGMYYMDPHAGRRRRALVRDRLAHARTMVTRQVPRTVERKGRYAGGVAKGLRHGAAEVAHLDGHHTLLVDDETLVARVRSEALREREIKAGEIHVDAYEGCVTLRGQLEQEAEIRHLIDVARRVEGVKEVRSYLHLPGTLPPNKAESYSRVPTEFARPF